MTTFDLYLAAYNDCGCTDARNLRGCIPVLCPCHPGSHIAGPEIGVQLDHPDPADLGHRCEGDEA